MKRLLFSLFLILSLSACGAQPTQTESAAEVQPSVIVPTTEEASPEASTFALNTPLPSDINAPLIEAPAIINIEMLNEVDGWGVTETEVVRTNDGGITWYNVTPPGLTDVGYLAFTDFLDATHAWVQSPDFEKYPNGGALYRTADGGINWEKIDTPFSGGVFKFLDESNGWMLADLGVGAGSMAVSVFQTTDGGSTWNRVYTNDPNIEGAGDTLPLGGIKNSMLPLDMGTAWVGGVVYAPGTIYLFRSENGGQTWTPIQLSLPQDSAESELSIEKIIFVNDQKGVIAVRVTSDSPQTILYTTVDGGTTWTQIPTVFYGMSKVDVPSADEWIVYYDDQFYVTTDAGITFNTIIPDVAFGDSLTDISFANSKTGWAITIDPTTSAPMLYKTTDGGTTWAQLIP